MAACGVSPRKRYRVSVDPTLCNSLGRPIFGRFDPGWSVAAVQPMHGCTRLVESIPPDDSMNALRRLRPGDLYRSLVVHEIAHAITHQAFEVEPTRPAYEYISAVAQIESLPDSARTAYLDAFAGIEFTTGMFNDLTLAMDPALFGAAAYRHFHRSDHGCGFMRSLLRESRVLPHLP